MNPNQNVGTGNAPSNLKAATHSNLSIDEQSDQKSISRGNTAGMSKEAFPMPTMPT